MGNYKFRLSDMMPNAWFYKLRDMSRTRNHNTSHPEKKKIPSPSSAAASHKPYFSQPYYHRTTETTRSAAEKFYNSPTNPKLSDTPFPDPPRKSSKRNRTTKISRKTIYKPSPRLVTCSVSASDWSTNNPEPARPRDCLLSSTESSFSSPDQSEFESNTIDGPDPFDGLSSSCSCRVTSSTTDIIIDVNGNSSFSRKVDHKLDGFDSIPGLQLPPILTKPVKFKEPAANPRRGSSSEFEEDHQSSFAKKDCTKTTTTGTPFARKCGSNSSTGVRIRANSPRIACKKVQGRRSVSSIKSSKSQRRSFSAESFAIVKSSFDPQRDFKDSMVEMIVENNIRASKDLEELLACYLSLNSDEYHELIVKAFEQIWFDMADLRM